ncbi:MAG TPA: hypothetical protein PK095_19170, partial [Myxococcota bacterium]|nr:hypothetical protein [Myxococcota bacterium]
MIHADKSRALPGKSKQPDLDAKGPKDALKGKSLAEQEKALTPPAPPASVSQRLAPVIAPRTTPDVDKQPVTKGLDPKDDLSAQRDALAKAPVEKPTEVDELDKDKLKEPELDKDKPKEPETDKDKPKEPETDKVEKKEPEKPKGPSKKELRRLEAEKRKELQLGQRELVRKQRDEKQEKLRVANEKEERERNERREQIRKKHERAELKKQAEKLLERINGLEPEVANALKEGFRGQVERIISKFDDEKVTNEQLSEVVNKASTRLGSVITETTREPEQQVKTGLVSLDSKGELTEARRYLGDRTLARQYAALEEAMNAGKWFTAKKCLEDVKTSVELLTPLIKEVMAWQPKVTWTNDKTLVDKKSAGPDRKAADLKDLAVQKLSERYTLGRIGLGNLAKWFKNEYEPFVQIPLTCSLWDTVKDNDTNAEGMLSSLLTAGVISGHYAKQYKTSYDTGGDYSVEYTVR